MRSTLKVTWALSNKEKATNQLPKKEKLKREWKKEKRENE